jgi:hypothetical protein
MIDERMIRRLERKKKDLLRKIDIYRSSIAAIDAAILVYKRIDDEPLSDDLKLREMIFLAIKYAPKDFSLRDIERNVAIQCAATNESFPKASIASSFWKIVNEEMKLPKIQEGSGRRPTIYRKASEDPVGVEVSEQTKHK